MADKTVASLTSSTPTIDDLTISYDNADTSELKKTTWQLVRDLYKTYFDTIYASLSGGTFTGDISVPAEVYWAGWNGSNEVPTKNDLYDKIETLGSGSVATDAIWDAKWDLAVGTGANTASRLAVGANGTIPIADSAEATGIRWGTPAGGWDVIKVWTPVNNQVGVWTGDGTLEGDAALTFDTSTDTLTTGTVNSTALTASELTATDASKNIVSLPVATYPSLTETSYVKGVTSSIQTQIDWKQASLGFTAENSANKSTTLDTDQASNTKYPSVKSVYDWATGLFALLAGSISQAFAVSQLEIWHATDTTITRVSAGVIAVEGVTVPTISSTSTITNKRQQPRIVSAASYTTDTGTSLDVSTTDIFVITAQAGALLFNSPSGTPVQGEKLIIRIKDNGTARALTWNAVFRAMWTVLPSTTVLSKTLYLWFVYNSTDTKWDLIASAQEA